MMLVKKYRPKKLSEIIGHTRIMESMRAYVANGDIPNMLFIGPPGNGKTSTVWALREEFGLAQPDFLELNASDERGIETIRKKVKNFAKTLSISDLGWKLCFMDEADFLTKPAQGALRRTMEDYPHIRFILAGNNLSGIKKPIQDRCTIYNFKGLHYTRIQKYVIVIAQKEGVRISEEIAVAIRQVSHGSMRTALNTLEGILSLENPTKDDVFFLHGVAPEESIFHLINSALKGDMKALKIMSDLNKTASATQTIRAMYGIAIQGRMRGLTDDKRLAILTAIGSIPGSSEDQRLGAIVSKLIISRT